VLRSAPVPGRSNVRRFCGDGLPSASRTDLAAPCFPASYRTSTEPTNTVISLSFTFLHFKHFSLSLRSRGHSLHLLRVPLRFVTAYVTGSTSISSRIYRGCYGVTGPGEGWVWVCPFRPRPPPRPRPRSASFFPVQGSKFDVSSSASFLAIKRLLTVTNSAIFGNPR
jgi:hypothetical protein